MATMFQISAFIKIIEATIEDIQIYSNNVFLVT